MSLQTKQLEQMYKTVQALKEMLFDIHDGYSEVTREAAYQMELLDMVMTPVAITTDMVKELRQLTGEGMMSCHKALKQSQGDMKEAVDILRNSGNI